MMTKKRHKKNKKAKTDTSSDASDEDEINQNNQLKQKNRILNHTVRTQTIQIHQLYAQIINLQEKEVKHHKRIEALHKQERYVKQMNKNNKKVKTAW